MKRPHIELRQDIRGRVITVILDGEDISSKISAVNLHWDAGQVSSVDLTIVAPTVAVTTVEEPQT